jgi:hypothetical protein
LALLQVVKDMKLPIDAYCYTAVIDGKPWRHVQYARGLVRFACSFRFLFACWKRVPRGKGGRQLWNYLKKWKRMESCQMPSRTGEYWWLYIGVV